MTEEIKKLQEKNRESLTDVMLFLPIKSAADVNVLTARLKLLKQWGVSLQYEETINHFVLMSYLKRIDHPKYAPALRFFVRMTEQDEWISVTIAIATSAEGGLEARLALPGIIASRTPDLVSKGGFWTEYMPMGWYGKI